jgi:amidohydrolase
MSPAFNDELTSLLDQERDSVIELRHEFHEYPEMAFEERRTTSVITNRLKELGWKVEDCPTETGAVATLDTGTPGLTVMLRADIDALPILEERDLPYRSRIDGVMHACGHDTHTAGLLGAAALLARRREALAGKYVVVFQPAEEGIGGAKAMVAGGILEHHGVQRMVGVHASSMAPLGYAALRPGIIMSEYNSFVVTLKGRGGHGAMATSAGNVVLAVAALAQRVPLIVDGMSFEGTDCACSAGVINAGTAPNVVPRSAVLRGSVRTFTAEQAVEALARLRELLTRLEGEFEITADLVIAGNAPAVRNDDAVTEIVEAATRAAPGIEGVLKIGPVTPSDDVSEFMNRVPGCYFFVGGALEDGSSGQHHSPEFAIDDRCVPIIAGVLAAGAVALAQR